MRKNKLEITITILFFGALWGLLEATLGYVLHFIPVLVSGLIMFPVASMILIKAYSALGKRHYLIYIAMITAAIKAIDFFLPGLPVIKTINPMIAIIVEAIVVAVAYPLFERRRSIKGLFGPISASIAWRAVFVSYNFVYFLISGSLASYLATPVKVLSFVVISGVFSGVILIGLLIAEGLIAKKLTQSSSQRKWVMKPSYGFIMLILALGVQYLI